MEALIFDLERRMCELSQSFELTGNRYELEAAMCLSKAIGLLKQKRQTEQEAYESQASALMDR